MSRKSENPIPPWNRFAVDATTAAEMLGLSKSVFLRRVLEGSMPPSVPGIRRWSVEALRLIKDSPQAQPQRRFERMPRSVPLGPGVQHLYRHFDVDGRLLYVGVSLSAVGRLCEHKKVSGWFWSIARVEVTAYANRRAVLKAERITILREKPLYNVVHARK